MNDLGLIVGESPAAPGCAMARRRRRRPSRRFVLARAGILGGLSLTLAAAAWWLLTAPIFAVARVDSGPYRYTDEGDLQAAFARCIGRNIWTLSTARIREQFAGLPWVREVTVRRRLPDSIAIELREWRPVLGLPPAGEGERGRLLLENGAVVGVPAHLDPPGLPLAIDAPIAEGRVGEPEASGLLALAAALATSGFEAVAPVDFILCRKEGYEIVLQSGQGSLQVGRGGFRERLERYLLARSRVPEGAQVDLRFRDRISFLPPAVLAARRDSVAVVAEVRP